MIICIIFNYKLSGFYNEIALANVTSTCHDVMISFILTYEEKSVTIAERNKRLINIYVTQSLRITIGCILENLINSMDITGNAYTIDDE